MKALNFSSLCCLLAVTICVTWSSDVIYAQTPNDSLRYYYDVIVSTSGRTELPDAVSYYQRNLEQCTANKDTLGSIYSLNLITTGMFDLNYLYDSEKAAVTALNLLDHAKYGDTMRYARNGLYTQLGKIYRATGNSERALDIYNEALSIAATSKESIVLINNKANVYKDIKQYKLAKDQLEQAYTIVKISNDSIRLALVLDNLGFIETELDEVGALDKLERALKIRSSAGNYSGMYSSHKSLSNYYQKNGAMSLARYHAAQAFKLAKLLDRSSNILDAMAMHIELNGDSLSLAFKALTDSLQKVKQKEENRYAYLKYNVDEEKKVSEAARLQSLEERRKKVIYQAIGGFVLLSALFSIILLRLKFKREKAQQVFNTEARISKKVHDEVANDVYHVMTKLQDNESGQDEILDDLEEIYSKTRDISKENSALNVNENFDELLNDLLISYQTTAVNVITQDISKIEWTSVSNLKKMTIYRVLQELMTNMRKHSKATLVVLTVRQSGNKISIKYKDNGVGSKVKKNMGLQNVENRIAAIRGTIRFESEIGEGFNAIITI